MKNKKTVWFISVVVVLLGCIMLGFFAYELVKITQEVQADDSYGAKVNQISDKPSELAKETQKKSITNNFKENKLIRPIKVEHGEEVTKEELMKHSWVLLENGVAQEDDQHNGVELVHMFTERKRKIITFDKQSGKALKERNKETGQELPPGDDESRIGYTMNGNEFHEEIKMHENVLKSTYKVYWIDDKIVFTPFDEYDHKEERQTVFQPVEFIEENEFVKNK